ncbi:uncharacterized protein LOC134532349 [Bacillus rossius redtenbacheri]|uniref:uncharacterized protein LOC134532349 n=1 Tax=Bacillus rossius redtenbacheri TaxID=93214 RepID=UPI002FDE2761
MLPAVKSNVVPKLQPLQAPAGKRGPQKQRARDRLQSRLPQVVETEIRRLRLPYHEALCLELEEEGFPTSAGFLRSLVQLDAQAHGEARPGDPVKRPGDPVKRREDPVKRREAPVKRRPPLAGQNQLLDKLQHGLREAEKARQTDDVAREAAALLGLGVFFMHAGDAWWWLADQLLLASLGVARDHTRDGGRAEALASYVYGLFLFEHMQEPGEAAPYLAKARDLAMGQSWDAEDELRRPQDTVFVESCHLLYLALTKMAAGLRDSDPARAVQLNKTALRRAHDSGQVESIDGAMLELGVSYIASGEYLQAVETLEALKMICFDEKDVEVLATTLMQLAFAYQCAGDNANALHHLRLYLSWSEENQLEVHIATAHRYLGEIFLKRNELSEATPFLRRAVFFFEKLGMTPQTEQSRALMALSASLMALPFVTALLLDGRDPSLRTLVRWKDSPKSFWRERPDLPAYEQVVLQQDIFE